MIHRKQFLAMLNAMAAAQSDAETEIQQLTAMVNAKDAKIKELSLTVSEQEETVMQLKKELHTIRPNAMVVSDIDIQRGPIKGKG